jgi:hypothetical protein
MIKYKIKVKGRVLVMSTLVKVFNGSWKVVKTGFKAIILLFVLLFIVALFSGTDTGSSSGSSSSVVEKYNIQNVKGTTSYGMVTITGTLVANKDYDYLQIEIPTYDSNGNKTGSALANINNLDKGETWKFEAIGTGGSNYNINKAEVTGF